MDEIGILPQFNDVMCHDHWKHYYRYACLHSLCNAYHLLELTRTYEQDNQAWVEEMQVFFVELNQEVDKTGGVLSGDRQYNLRRHCQAIFKAGEMKALRQYRWKANEGGLRKLNHVTYLSDYKL